MSATKTGRQPVQFIEIRLDRCSLTYGETPCTAAIGVTGDTQCFNAFRTCQDPDNYDPSDKLVLRFASPHAMLPGDLEVIPTLQSLRQTPARIEPGKSLGRRASVSAVVADHPYHDRLLDPYHRTRDPAFAPQGSFWARLLARNPYYNGREMYVYTGYVGQPLSEYRKQRYMIERIEGPDGAGSVKITGKDPLKAVDDDRAVCPRPSTGQLSATLTDDGMSLTLTPTGVGNAEYPASGWAIIGGEIVTFTRSGDNVTLTARGLFGTEQEEHDEGETFQVCARFNNTPWAVMRSLWINFANGDPNLIPFSEWEAEGNRWLGGLTVNALICEPTGVRELWDQLCEQTLSYVWWDELEQKIRFKALRPASAEEIVELTDDGSFVEESFAVKDKPEERITTVIAYFGIRNPSTDIEEGANYRAKRVRMDVSAASSFEYGDQRIKTIYGRWFQDIDDGAATRLTFRTLGRYRDTPREYSFALDAKDRALKQGDVARITTRTVTDFTGRPDTRMVEIIEASEAVAGHRYEYRAIDYVFTGRYCIIMQNNAPDYPNASLELRNTGGWIGPDSTDFSDGTERYRIL